MRAALLASLVVPRWCWRGLFLFHGDDNAAIGGEGEGAGVVDLTNQVIGAGFVGEGDLYLGALGLVDGGVDRLAGEFLEPPFES